MQRAPPVHLAHDERVRETAALEAIDEPPRVRAVGERADLRKQGLLGGRGRRQLRRLGRRDQRDPGGGRGRRRRRRGRRRARRRRGARGRDRRRALRRHGAHFDSRRAVAHHAELERRGVREVDEPIVDERSAVVDLHDDALAVVEVRDLDPGRDRQRFVRRRHRVHVVGLAARGREPVEVPPVPRRDSARAVAVARREHVVAMAEHVVERRIAAVGVRARATGRPGARVRARRGRVRGAGPLQRRGGRERREPSRVAPRAHSRPPRAADTAAALEAAAAGALGAAATVAAT